MWVTLCLTTLRAKSYLTEQEPPRFILFLGATSEDMLDFIRPLTYRNPDSIIVHAGTNDLTELTTKEILENYLDIMTTIKEINQEIKIVFSSVIQRHDDISLQPRIHDLNNQMREFCNKHKAGFIDNSSMKDNHIGLKGLYLNLSGKARLAINFKEYLKDF